MATFPEYNGRGDWAEFVLNAAGAYLVELMQANLKAQGLQDSRLYKGLTYTVKGDQLEIVLPDYARWVEQGRRPFGVEQRFPVNSLPPMAAILDWIKRKRIKGRNKKGQFISNNSLAWAIRVMISKRGIKPRPFVAPALDTAETEINEYFATSYSLLIDSQIETIIN